MISKFFINCLQVAILTLLSIKFTFSSNIKCELKCTKWDFVCTKPSYSPKLPYVVCNPSNYPQYPKCADDVAKIVKEANAKGVAVKSFGKLQHTQTDLICTEGIPISISALQSYKMNADNTATFGAGVTLYDCGEFLRKNGRAFATLSVFGNRTLSGALLTGEQGNSLKFDATISSQVVTMTIVNSKGEIQIISSPDELKAFSLSLGLLGILVDVTLRTVPLYKVRAHNYIECDDILSNGKAEQWARDIDELSLYWFPESAEVVVSNRTIVHADTPGNARSNDFLLSTYSNFARVLAKALETAFSLTSSTCTKANAAGYEILHKIEHFMKSSLVEQTPEMLPIYTEDGSTVQNPAVGYAHLISSSICSGSPQGSNGAACSDSHGADSITTLDNEFSIALCDLPDFVKTVKDIIKTTPTAFPLLGIRITFSGKSKIFLSTSYDRESVNVAFRMPNRKDLFKEPSASLAGYQAILQALIFQFSGRSNWGKGGLVAHNAESIDLKLEQCDRDSFIDVLNKNDPKGVFMNKIGLRLKGKGTRSDANPLSIHCALLGGCFCSKNSDCGPNQTCSTLPGFIYRVCRTKNEEPECAICNCKKNTLPPLKDLVKYFDVDVPKLATNVLSTCTM